MSKNSRIPSNENTELPPAHQMVIEMLRTFRGYTTKSKCTCTGQCTIERAEGIPLVVMYASYPNGDYLCWFNDNTGFTMYSLVNEKFQHVLSCTAEELPMLIEAANELKPKLGT